MQLMVLAPSGRRISETFVRANIKGLSFSTVAYYGDLYGPQYGLLQMLYASASAASKMLSKLGMQRFATLLMSTIAFLLQRIHRPDCIIAEFGFHAVMVMEASVWARVPLIVHFRGADLSAHRYIIRLRHRYRRLLQIVDAVVVKSQPMRRRIEQLAQGRSEPLPVLVSPSGADPSRFPQTDSSNAPPVFLAVGRFVPKKGPLYTLRAFELAARSRPQLRLIMVGDGPLLPVCQAWVLSHGLQNCVEFTGAQSSDRIATYLQQARGFLQHSITALDGDEEGCPVAVIEAQLSGLPVVATYHAGIPDVVLHGQTGLLVTEGDVTAMASAISILADEPDFAGQLGAAGALHCRNQFTLQHHLIQLEDLISTTVLRSRAHSFVS